MDKDHALEEMMGKLGECEFNLFKTYGNISVAFEEHLLNFPTRCFCELISIDTYNFVENIIGMGLYGIPRSVL